MNNINPQFMEIFTSSSFRPHRVLASIAWMRSHLRAPFPVKGVDPQRKDKLSKACEREQARSADPEVLIDLERAIMRCRSDDKGIGSSCFRPGYSLRRP